MMEILPNHDVKIYDYDYFYTPSNRFLDVNDFFFKTPEYKNAYCHHLWGSVHNKLFNKITTEQINKKNSYFNNIAREIL